MADQLEAGDLDGWTCSYALSNRCDTQARLEYCMLLCLLLPVAGNCMQSVWITEPLHACMQTCKASNAADCQCGGHVPPAQPQVKPGYDASLCRYAGKDESVAPHTDKLTALGRRPIIASLSLGATRTFRVTRAPVREPRGSGAAGTPAGQKPAQGKLAGASAAGAGAQGLGQAAVGGVGQGRGGGGAAAPSGADIALPHNTLLIMWPPTQEEFLHEVRRWMRRSARKDHPGLACPECQLLLCQVDRNRGTA